MDTVKHAMNIGEKKMADKFNITGIDVEFQDGLIDELKQKHKIGRAHV